jgi:hypothetical protein
MVHQKQKSVIIIEDNYLYLVEDYRINWIEVIQEDQ